MGIPAYWHHVDTVDRAGLNTQITAATFLLEDGVHEFCSTEDGVQRTGLNAEGTADALSFPDDRHRWQLIVAGARVQRLAPFVHEISEVDYGAGSPRRTTVDRLPLDDRPGIGPAAFEAAASTLGLGK